MSVTQPSNPEIETLLATQGAELERLKGQLARWRRTTLAGFGFIALVAMVAAAQQPNGIRNLTPVAQAGQIVAPPAVQSAGVIGITALKAIGGFEIQSIAPKGPAARAGVHVGDVLISVNGHPVANVSQIDFQGILATPPGEKVDLVLFRGGSELSKTMLAAPYGAVYPGQPPPPATIKQDIFGGHAVLSAAMVAQGETATLWLLIQSKDAEPFSVDDGKFFLLDASGNQLQRITLAQFQYFVQLYVARNWRGGSYPPPTPPPAQQRYTITSTETGAYSLSPLGNSVMVSGTTTSTYTVQQQPDYNQLGYMLAGC